MMAPPCGVVSPSEVVTPPRLRLSPSPGVGRGGDRRPEVEVESEPRGRARRRFLWRPRLDLAAVGLTLAGGTAVGAA
jgi:hypothetical protein